MAHQQIISIVISFQVDSFHVLRQFTEKIFNLIIKVTLRRVCLFKNETTSTKIIAV